MDGLLVWGRRLLGLGNHGVFSDFKERRLTLKLRIEGDSIKWMIEFCFCLSLGILVLWLCLVYPKNIKFVGVSRRILPNHNGSSGSTVGFVT
jgi:hypothetical protein